jgi:hypothetical protein
MAIYSVHIPGDGADPTTAAERANFLREGFCWPAFLFGPLWLLARGLWRPLGAWCLGAILVGLTISHGLLRGSAGSWLYFIAALFLGLEGKGFVGAAMERRGLQLIDVATGPDLAAAESGFFSRWLAGLPAVTPTPPPAARPNAPIAEGHGPIIGMFPEAGG